MWVFSTCRQSFKQYAIQRLEGLKASQQADPDKPKQKERHVAAAILSCDVLYEARSS